MKAKKPLNVIIVLAASVFCITAGLFLCSYLGTFFYEGTINQSYIKAIVPRVVMAIIFIIFMKIVYRQNKLGFGREGFVKGLCFGSVMIFYIIENFISGSDNSAYAKYDEVTMLNYLLCFGCTMAIGLFEEVLLRGVVLTMMNEQWKDSKYGSYIAVVVSSILFGVAHMINYINGKSNLNPTIAQMFYATFIGMFMAAVYLKCKNIWSVIVLHALFDFAQEYWELVAPTYRNSKPDMTGGTIISLIIFYLPLAIVALFITKSYVEERRRKEEILFIEEKDVRQL